MTATVPFSLRAGASGLRLDWTPSAGVRLGGVPVRVRIQGHNIFQVWAGMDSGEDAPAWAEKNLNLTLFGPDSTVTVGRLQGAGVDGFVATAVTPRAEARLEMRLVCGELETSLAINCPQTPGARPLPVCLAELSFGGLDLGKDGFYYSGLPYGGGTYGYGKFADIQAPGVNFVHGCIGLALPLVCLHDARQDAGVRFEFMLEGRPQLWIRPRKAGKTTALIQWTPDRLLEPGKTHAFGGKLRLKGYEGRPVEQLWAWRDEAGTRYGLKAPARPKCLEHARIIHFDMCPDHNQLDFKRLDDPKCHAMIKAWAERGFNTVYAISDNNIGRHWLSPFDYDPRKDVGGAAAERKMLKWMHQYGMTVYFWTTTVGLDTNAPATKAHPEWFTYRANGRHYYAWDSNAKNDFVGYAPDADPQMRGWREWYKNQMRRLLERGYDGIFIDGCIPRASNHARWYWPGEGRNGVETQVLELGDFVRGVGRELGRDTYLIVEDNSLAMQTVTEIPNGRYYTDTPFMLKAAWDFGMGGGPESVARAPAKITPEMARDFLLQRHAMLPGVMSAEGAHGYVREGTRPWIAQAILAGCAVIADNSVVNKPAIAVDGDKAKGLSDLERDPEHRRKGFAEYFRLIELAVREPLVRRAPLSIDGVTVEGDGAVVGFLRPSAKRCLLALIQFADRAAEVKVRLREPRDIPAIQRKAAGQPQSGGWKVREVLRSMVDAEASPEGAPSRTSPLRASISAYGFRVFELRR